VVPNDYLPEQRLESWEPFTRQGQVIYAGYISE